MAATTVLAAGVAGALLHLGIVQLPPQLSDMLGQVDQDEGPTGDPRSTRNVYVYEDDFVDDFYEADDYVVEAEELSDEEFYAALE